MPNPSPFQSMTYERKTGCGDLYVTLGEKNKKLTYVSIDMGKATCGADNFTAWLFNPENFFGAMAAWIKEGI